MLCPYLIPYTVYPCMAYQSGGGHLYMVSWGGPTYTGFGGGATYTWFRGGGCPLHLWQLLSSEPTSRCMYACMGMCCSVLH